MATTVKRILEEANKYLGVVAGDKNHMIIIDTYNSAKPLPQNFVAQYDTEWCDIFISFLAIQTNATDIIARECGVERHIDLFKQMGIWNENGAITPKPGDLITFHWGKNSQPNDGYADHIGIVEKVENGYIKTIEGNSNNAVRRSQYIIGDGRIRGFASPRYISETKHISSEVYNEGPLVNYNYTLSQQNIQIIIKYAGQFSLTPSFMIAQLFFESHWGNKNGSLTAKYDNNWAGITEPFKVPNALNIHMSQGTPRPLSETGHYVRFMTVDDFFKGFAFLLSKENGIYNVTGARTIEEYCKGLFPIGGARSSYAAVGYDIYQNKIISVYNAIKSQNTNKLAKIDALAKTSYQRVGYEVLTTSKPNGLNQNRIPESGTFSPNQTVNIRNNPSQSATIVGQYFSGESFIYDSYVVNEGYEWLSYISYSGERRYVAWRMVGGMTFGHSTGRHTSTPPVQQPVTPPVFHPTVLPVGPSPINRVSESGVFYPNQTISIRNKPSLSGTIVGHYSSGESFTYDSYVVNERYVWLSYLSYTGERRYVAWRDLNGEKFGTIH